MCQIWETDKLPSKKERNVNKKTTETKTKQKISQQKKTDKETIRKKKRETK